MTEEYPINNKSDYEFPEPYLSDLQNHDIGDPRYKIARGYLYEGLRSRTDDVTQAGEVVEHLDVGEVDIAIEKVHKLLGDSSE